MPCLVEEVVVRVILQLVYHSKKEGLQVGAVVVREIAAVLVKGKGGRGKEGGKMYMKKDVI